MNFFLTLMSKGSHNSSAESVSPSEKLSMTSLGMETLVKGDITSFARMMKTLVNNTDFSDIKFMIGPNRKEIFAHRCILSARCTVFKAMLSEKPGSGDTNIPLVLSDMSPDVFIAMLEFLYTNCVTLSSKNAIDVLATSLEYGLDDLRDLCVDFLAANMSVNTACDVMQAAVIYNQNDLKEKAMVFIEANTAEVLKTRSFQEISEDTLVSILRSSRLNIDEMDLYKAVKEWATVSSVVNGKNICEIARNAIKHIRLPLLSAEELTALEEENRRDHFIPDNTFACAWKLHALKHGDKENILSICRQGTNPRAHHKYLLDEAK